MKMVVARSCGAESRGDGEPHLAPTRLFTLAADAALAASLGAVIGSDESALLFMGSIASGLESC